MKEGKYFKGKKTIFILPHHWYQCSSSGDINFWAIRNGRERKIKADPAVFLKGRLQWHELKCKPKKRVVRDSYTVVEAFLKGRELRTPFIKTVNSDWTAGICMEGIRDEVKIDGGIRTYYLWGSPIAILEGGILTIDNCGHETQLTVRRLWNIVFAFFPDYEKRLFMPAKTGWRRSWRSPIKDYPVRIDVKTGKVLNGGDLRVEYLALLRATSTYSMEVSYRILKKVGPPPSDLSDRVAAKLFHVRLLNNI